MTKTKLIRANDKLSREINRKKKYCERCGRGSPYQLHWCHIYGRRAKNLRWHPSNWLLLCAACHRWQHENPLEFTEWFDNTFGEDRKKELQALYNAVKPMSLNDYQKINDDLVELLLLAQQ